MTHRHDFRVSSVPKPEIGRERVRQACHRCRLKKLKCDGIVPCGRCIKDDMLCQHRERKGTGIEQTHSEYVSRLEEQQRILATALKLTWTRLHPDEGGQMPSAHEIIMRLRLMPASSSDTRRESTDETSPNSKQSPDVNPEMPSPPDSSQGQLESAQSSLASTPALAQQNMLLSYDFGSGVQQADIHHVVNTFPDFFARSPVEWGGPQDESFSPTEHESALVEYKRPAERQPQPLRALSSASLDDFTTIEPWQLMLEEQ